MTLRAGIIPILFLGACAPAARSEGSILGMDFTDAASAFHGGTAIVLVDRKVDCIDLGWVGRRYHDGIAPAGADDDFVALQITLTGGLEPGTYTLGMESPFRADGLVMDDGEFSVAHVREGILTLDEVEVAHVAGEFSLSFAQDAVGGSFITEECAALGY